jgi:hypothetical protein
MLTLPLLAVLLVLLATRSRSCSARAPQLLLHLAVSSLQVRLLMLMLRQA